MDAVTLRPVHAYCVTHEGKDLENRSKAPPARVVGRDLCIHAGANYETAVAADLWRRLHVRVPRDVVRSAIVAVATVARVVTAPEPAIARWWLGPVGWVLTNVRVLPEPVQCERGQLGVWRVPLAVEERVRELLASMCIGARGWNAHARDGGAELTRCAFSCDAVCLCAHECGEHAISEGRCGTDGCCCKAFYLAPAAAAPISKAA